jgi:hypothetical protein
MHVNCGGHKAARCEKCPLGHGKSWCNGDWNQALCLPLPKYVHPAYEEVIKLHPFQAVRDEKRQLVNIILFHEFQSSFFTKEQEQMYEKYKNDILFLGIMSYETFPFPGPNPWSNQFPRDKYLDKFPGWLNMYRNPNEIFSPQVKILQVGIGLQSPVDQVRRRSVARKAREEVRLCVCHVSSKYDRRCM